MAEDTEQDQKTEAPTGKRLNEARERGQLPLSREISTWATLVASLIVVAYLGPGMSEQMLKSLRPFIETPHMLNLEGPGLQTALLGVLQQIGLATSFIFALLFVAAILGTMLQTDFYINPTKLKVDFMALSWANGIKKLFSINSIFELVKSFFKLVVLGGIAYLVLVPIVEKLPFYTGRDLVESMGDMIHMAVRLIVILMVVITIIALADMFYQRHEYIKSLKMTKTEVKDEHKEMEGDPKIKARLRQIRREKARRRMIAAVPKADVIITNPTHYAVALQYDSKKMRAPVLLAKGVDSLALRIREVAEEHKVPFVSNPPLARTLHDNVEIDEAIKPEHYRAVAEVISFVYKLKNKKAT